MRIPGLSLLFWVVVALALPGSAMALDYRSDFSDYASDWDLENGSAALQDNDSIVLSAAGSPHQRGRILTKSILATTAGDILNSTFILDVNEMTAPVAARALFFDSAGNFIRSAPLLGSREGGRLVVSGTALNPDNDVAGLKIRLYSNGPTGSVRFSNFQITNEALPIPEPSTALLMGLGLGALAAVRYAPRA